MVDTRKQEISLVAYGSSRDGGSRQHLSLLVLPRTEHFESLQGTFTHINNTFHHTYCPFPDTPVSLLRYCRMLCSFQGYVSAPPKNRFFGISSNLAFPCPPVLWLGLDGQRRTSYTRLCQGCHHDLDRPLRNGGPCRRSSGASPFFLSIECESVFSPESPFPWRR